MRPNSPGSLSPEQRFREVARLLAAAVRRLLSARGDGRHRALEPPEKPREIPREWP